MINTIFAKKLRSNSLCYKVKYIYNIFSANKTRYQIFMYGGVAPVLDGSLRWSARIILNGFLRKLGNYGSERRRKRWEGRRGRRAPNCPPRWATSLLFISPPPPLPHPPPYKKEGSFSRMRAYSCVGN